MRLAPTALALLTVLALATPAEAQLFGVFRARPAQVGPPEGTPPHEAEIWPFPPPDPKSWWEDKRLKPDEASDPLGGRRIRRGERLPQVSNGIDASTYRLWGLMPLQWQLLRSDEMILEVWTRPSTSVRQTVTRVIVRGDDDVFVQARAGLACCEAGIARRMGFDRELPPGSADKFRALREHYLWRSPRDVRVEESGAAEAVCVDGTAYDLTLLVRGGARTVRRACDPAEIGEAADVLEAVLGAAMGHDPRFDVIFPGGANYANDRAAYVELIESGGKLKPEPNSRRGRPNFDPQPIPPPEPEAPPAAPAPEPS